MKLITIDMDALAKAIDSNTDASEREARAIINTVLAKAPAPVGVEPTTEQAVGFFVRNEVGYWYQVGSECAKTDLGPRHTGMWLYAAPAGVEPAPIAPPCKRCDATIFLSMSPPLAVHGTNEAMEELSRRLAATQASAPVAQPASEPAVAMTLEMVRALPTINGPLIDGEESDGTPIYWRSRPFVSLTHLERLLRAATQVSTHASKPTAQAEQIALASQRLTDMVVTALGARSPAMDDLAVLILNARAATQASAPPAPAGSDAELRRALSDAATSLEAIGRTAGHDDYMKGRRQVRGYANSRAQVARAALRAQDKESDRG